MKYLSSLLILAMSLCLFSCNDDETENKESFTIKQTNKVSSVDTTTIYSAEYRYDINYTSGTMNITASNVRFAPRMPAITFTMNDIPFTYTSNGINLSANNIVPVAQGYENTEMGYVITNLSGRIVTSTATSGISVIITYIINYENVDNGETETYSVTADPAPMVFDQNSETAITGGRLPYSSTSSIYSVKLDETSNTAVLYIYNAQFAEKMPAMNMVFRGITVVPTSLGYELSCDSLIPAIVGETSETPAPNYEISDVSATIENDTIKLSFVCTITDENNSALGSYNVTANASMFPTIK